MPHPISYPVGTQDDDLTRSIDVVHIEPSIREGMHLVSSLYGPLASAPLYRFPPINTFSPYVTGDPQIPNVLTCNSGQWAASPSVVLFYQWMSNGADIPGATERTWTSTPQYDNTVITCEVRGTNYLGEAYAITSNSITISLIEPIEIEEQENYFITGLPQGEKAQTMRDERTIITSGMSAENRHDIQRLESYFTSGMSATNRQDLNAMSIYNISGLQQPTKLAILERDVSINVVNWDIGSPLQSTIPQLMHLKNPEAELGLEGWTVFGAVRFGSYGSDFVNAKTYTHWWDGGEDVDANQANIPYSYIYQDVPVFPVWETDVDSGTCYVSVDWYQLNLNNDNQANARLEYYSANNTFLGFNSGPGLWASPNNIWFLRTMLDAIPSSTRYIRVILEWNLQEDQDNDTKIDTVRLKISKDLPSVDRNFGPNFEQWRLRFSRANTWSGGALSEIEMRDTPGTIDLATGGSVIFGSAGLGATNADAVFDDSKDTNYWAGAENSIANGTSWVGYNFGTLVKPGEIEITARPGSDALQVPKDWYLEGSHDGIKWIPVQFIDETMHTGGVNYNSGESKTIEIPDGPIPFWRDTVGFNAVWKQDTFGTDDRPGKGTVFKCLSRINIDTLSVLIEDQAVPYNYRLQLCRLNTQKNGNLNAIGMVSEVLEEITNLTSPGVSSNQLWTNHNLINTYTFEVDDLFLIYFFDDDVATNPNDPERGRTYFFSSNSSISHSHDKTTRRVVDRIAMWQGTKQTLEIGDVADNKTTNFYSYAVDFSGEVF